MSGARFAQTPLHALPLRDVEAPACRSFQLCARSAPSRIRADMLVPLPWFAGKKRKREEGEEEDEEEEDE